MLFISLATHIKIAFLTRQDADRETFAYWRTNAMVIGRMIGGYFVKELKCKLKYGEA